MSVEYAELPNSSFLDYNDYRASADLTAAGPDTNFVINVGLVLDRANDPTALLSADWASRQQQLQTMTDNGTLWSTYGADPAKYNQILSDLSSMGIPTVDQVDPNNGYVSSVESRTIWVQVTAQTFNTLFGPSTAMVSGTDSLGVPADFWTGNLSLPSSWLQGAGVKGLILDTEDLQVPTPTPVANTPVDPPLGFQSPGNASSEFGVFAPQSLARAYHFPLAGSLWDPSSGRAVATGSIGLIEVGVGDSLPDGSTSTFQSLLDQYRSSIGIDSPSTVVAVAPGGEAWNDEEATERGIDVGVVTAVNPQSPIVLYAGSGQAANAESDPATVSQQAFWDDANKPEVVASSWFGDSSTPSAGSPFLWAQRQLVVDAALRNITALNASGDGGSGDAIPNGVTNVNTAETSPYALIVGGTSLNFTSSAENDDTLSDLVAAAQALDPTTIWQLVAGGLDTLPTADAPNGWLVETVWNQYLIDGSAASYIGYLENEATTGGIDTTQPTPSYQRDFGLTPTTADPDALTGRGVPDVSAAAAGNSLYYVPSSDMTTGTLGGGTSASSPFWGALVSQIDAVFHDQGLPTLGYMNDLLYTAAVIAPASFNDVTIGNNTSSIILSGSVDDGLAIETTGYGYSAGPGYDLTTGLGTPNGMLLTRALTEIAHQQMYFSTVPDVLEANGNGGWQSGTDQSLLFQTSANAPVNVTVATGSDTTDYTSDGSAAFAWTSQFAEQTLQPDFDPNLVTMFDGQSQGTVMQQTVSDGDQVSVGISGTNAGTPQANLSTPFGFADFTSSDGSVRVAQSVAVAETAGGQNDQDAVIRVRQNGAANLSLELYRVDDYEGTVAGLAPGSAGYAAAADARAYQFDTGGTSLSGPGYGLYAQAEITDVNACDLVAMKLTNNTTSQTYWAFAQANPDGAAHTWNYGANVWGWEDMYGGGDHDYNDLVVQIDFTSTAGHGYLVTQTQ